jgi:hypothetical protein
LAQGANFRQIMTKKGVILQKATLILYSISEAISRKAMLSLSLDAASQNEEFL